MIMQIHHMNAQHKTIVNKGINYSHYQHTFGLLFVWMLTIIFSEIDIISLHLFDINNKLRVK